MSTQLERQMQSVFLSQLSTQGYTVLPKERLLEDTEALFRQEVERLNSVKLSDQEFERLYRALQTPMSQAYELLRSGVLLVLDNNATRTIRLYDSTGQANSFQVAEEVKIPSAGQKRRLDVVVFMNGLPIIAGELKKLGKGIGAALGDVNTYTREGIYRHGLLKFVQLYFVSDGEITKYFATSLDAEGGEPYNNTFYWADPSNKPIKMLYDRGSEKGWASTFFATSNVFHLISLYMLKTEGRDKRIIVLRPYQIHAIEAGMKRLLETGGNGFFWHATGSGKTLTSFMLCRALAESGKYAKIVMLLDRIDLADQTLEEYAGFSGTKGTVARGRDLLTQLNDPSVPFVMTTLQSMAKLLGTKWKNRRVKALFSKNVAFVVDECHRTTFGGMFKDVRLAFPEGQFIGFTGTPILPENKTAQDQVTKDLFGEPIHVYTTKNAIDDGNVLPFEISEVDLKTNKTLSAMTEDERQARRELVADYISTHLWKHTFQRNLNPKETGGKKLVRNPDHLDSYTALLATESIDDAFAYWRIVTPKLQEQNRRTAVVFSFSGAKDNDENGRNYLTEVLRDYDEQQGTSFLARWEKQDKDVVRDYIRDVTNRVKRKEIDLVVVAFMLLTGFDSKTLNTLYADKHLRDHGLLQAMSRTNRVYKSNTKAVGNVVLFGDRAMRENVDDAIRLFSNGNATDGVVFRKDFIRLRNEITSQVKQLQTDYPEPASVDEVGDRTSLRDLVGLFGSLRTNLTRMRTYDQWDGEAKDWAHIGISEDDLERYYSRILDAKDRLRPRESEAPDEDFTELELSIAGLKQKFTIDVAYINELMRNAIFAPPKDNAKWVAKARKAKDSSDDPEVMRHAEAIEATLQEIEAPGSSITNVDELFRTLEEKKAELRASHLEASASFLGIEPARLETLVATYDATGVVPTGELSMLLGNQGLTMAERRSKKEGFGKIVAELSRN